MSKSANGLIHPTAVISPEALIEDDVAIGPYSVIHGAVRIGAGSRIESHCELGVASALAEDSPLVLGPRALIRSHTILYQGSQFGSGLTTGHHATIREMTSSGDGLQVGTLGDVQGHCEFGNYVRLHSNVHIGQGSRVGSFVWIFPYCVLTNDPHPPSEVRHGVTVESFAVIATMCTILPGVRIGEGSLVAAGSTVTREVMAGRLVRGNPARDVGAVESILLRDGSGSPAYPWKRRFKRGYPPAISEDWSDP